VTHPWGREVEHPQRPTIHERKEKRERRKGERKKEKEERFPSLEFKRKKGK